MMSRQHIKDLYKYMLKNRMPSSFKVRRFDDGEVRIVFDQPMPGHPHYSPEKYIPNIILEPTKCTQK